MIFDRFNATLWRKIDSYGRERMDKMIARLELERGRLSDKCLAAEEPMAIAQLKGTFQRNDFYQPPGIKLAGYELRADQEDNPACRHLVQPENSFSKELFDSQRQRQRRTRRSFSVFGLE